MRSTGADCPDRLFELPTRCIFCDAVGLAVPEVTIGSGSNLCQVDLEPLFRHIRPLRAQRFLRRLFSGLSPVATTTAGLLELAEWLETAGCTHVAMEATGVYWKPVWHVLEGHFALVLANAMHIRNVPGPEE